MQVCGARNLYSSSFSITQKQPSALVQRAESCFSYLLRKFRAESTPVKYLAFNCVLDSCVLLL